MPSLSLAASATTWVPLVAKFGLAIKKREAGDKMGTGAIGVQRACAPSVNTPVDFFVTHSGLRKKHVRSSKNRPSVTVPLNVSGPRPIEILPFHCIHHLNMSSINYSYTVFVNFTGKFTLISIMLHLND